MDKLKVCLQFGFYLRANFSRLANSFSLVIESRQPPSESVMPHDRPIGLLEKMSNTRQALLIFPPPSKLGAYLAGEKCFFKR